MAQGRGAGVDSEHHRWNLHMFHAFLVCTKCHVIFKRVVNEGMVFFNLIL